MIRPFGISAKLLLIDAVFGGSTMLLIRLGVTATAVGVPAVPPFGTVPASVRPFEVCGGCVGSRTE